MRYLSLTLAVLAATACGDGTSDPTQVAMGAVIDGDTVRIVVAGDDEEVRLIGVNAPERDDCHSAESTEALRMLLESGELRIEGDERDRFGRLLAYVYAGDTLANLSLIESGHGLAMSSDHRRADEFVAAGERAWTQRLGMWDPAACGEPPDIAVTIDAIEPDPPGDDRERPNDEIIVLHNGGGSAADISGWRLRDESSVHRYVIPDGTSVGPGQRITIHSGCGTDGPADLYWCAGPVWSNGGDTAILQAPGGTVVDRSVYTGR